MKDPNPKIYDQMIDYLCGSLSGKNKTEFEQWLENDENLVAFNKVKAIWEGNHDSHNEYAESSWQKLEGNLKDRNKSVIRRHLFQISVAASLLVLIASGWFLKNSTHKMVSLTTTEDTFIKDTLKDGSIVYLYPSSTLEMKCTDKLCVNEEINLEGEAFFVVPEEPQKETVINVGDVAIKVKGTSFRVNTSENGEIYVMVESGSVELFSNKTGNKKLLVEAGEEAYYSALNKQIWKQQKKENIYLIYQPTNVN